MPIPWNAFFTEHKKNAPLRAHRMVPGSAGDHDSRLDYLADTPSALTVSIFI